MTNETTPTPPTKEEVATTKCWMYSKEKPKGRLFEAGEVVPAGYKDAPAKKDHPNQTEKR